MKVDCILRDEPCGRSDSSGRLSAHWSSAVSDPSRLQVCSSYINNNCLLIYSVDIIAIHCVRCFFILIICYKFILKRNDWLVTGLPVVPADRVIQLQLIQLMQGGGLADGLVLAGTIVEGGPVIGRRRKILGGQSVHPGLEYVNIGFQLDKCPQRTFGYQCRSRVPPECAVNRHLLYRGQLCTCTVDVCR